MPSIRQMTPITSSEVMLMPPAADRDRNAHAAAAGTPPDAAAILDILAFPIVVAVSHVQILAVPRLASGASAI